MEILRASSDTLLKDKIGLYQLIRGESKSFLEKVDQDIDIQDWALFRSEGTYGSRDVLAFKENVTGTVYAGVSPTIIEEFLTMVECGFNTPVIHIVKSTSSRKGREFLTCTLVRE